LGKEIVANQLVSHICLLLEKVKVNPITLEWHDKVTQNGVPLSAKPSLTQMSTRLTGKRTRKLPITRNEDFLWITLKTNSLDSLDNTETCLQLNNTLNIYHQNICGLKEKTDELINSLYPLIPHLLCISEHHRVYSDLCHTCINHYNLGAQYCRKTLRQGGVCIFVHDSINYTSVNLNCFCKEQDLKACAVKLQILSDNIFILAIYRAPTGDLEILHIS
jgi:hypothetical protein